MLLGLTENELEMTNVSVRTQEFNSSQKEWQQYIERLSHVFPANRIKENDCKWDIFQSVIGAKTYKVLSDLLSPDKPGKNYSTELSKTLENHYSPNPSEIIERFHFAISTDGKENQWHRTCC